MAAVGFSYVKTRGIRGCFALLVYAVCEWFLISLLFIDSLLSYLLTKFATSCGLQPPCILCSRLDRVLDGENAQLYHTLFCSNHRSKIPSLISCHHIHGSDSVAALQDKSVDVSQASDNGIESAKNREEFLKEISTRAGAFKETDLIVNEHPTEEEVDRVNEELKLLSSESSSPQGSHMSLVFPISDDAYNVPDAFSSSETQGLQKSFSVESGLGSLGDINVNEIEGESLVDQLKRQIAYDKKCLSSLYQELEEERNASAIATNQTMAMITRLQEEKAALHMESLQYLRMMDEQAEHDAHALEKADELLSEKEKLIQDLENELDFYRLNLEDEPMLENMHREGNRLQAENMTVQSASVPHISNTINTYSNLKTTEVSKSCDESMAAETPSLEFEEEKLYLSQWLKNLEKKLHQSSDGFPNGEDPPVNGLTEETDMPVQKEISELNDKLEALQADYDLLECIVKSLQDGNNIQLVQEIACQLHELRKIGIRSRW